MPRPPYGSPDYNAFVTLANDVSTAAIEAAKHHRPLFSERQAMALVLWDMGYRPTPEQVEAEIARQQTPRERP